MDKITFCIPSKNNLRYLKWCIPSIRNNSYRKDHDIIVFVDKDTDGTIKWLEDNKQELNIKYIVNPDLNNSLYGIGRAYDKCISEASTDIVMVFHADMYLCKNADLIMHNALKHKSVVCATRIEPPLHPEGVEKVVKDFGLWPESDVENGFNESALTSYVEIITKENAGKITNGCFAPWMIRKNDVLEIGGHDPIMKSAREDSDIFNRFVLNNLELIQVRDAFVYHLTCRGGQFEHGILTKNHSQKSKDWQELMEQSTWDYVRKWGCFVQHDMYLNPIITPKYDIGFILNTTNDTPYSPLIPDIIRYIEPWVSTIYLNDLALVEAMRKELHGKTEYDAERRIKNITDEKTNDVLIELNLVDITNLNSELKWVMSLNDILSQADEIGMFELEKFKVEIRKLNNMTKELIKIKNEFF